MTRDEAETAIMHGAIAACVSAGITLLMVLIAMTSQSANETISSFNDAWNLIDVGLILVLAFFIWRKSRVAAVLMFLYFIVAKLITMFESGAFTGGLIAILFIWLFGRAAWATFLWHGIEKRENPDYKTTKTWLLWLLAPVILIILGLLGLGVASTTSLAPATVVQTGEQMPDRQNAALREAGIVTPDEDILYYYSEALFDIAEAGSILTDQRVIAYWTEDEALKKIWLPFEDIDRVEIVEDGHLLADAVYHVHQVGEEDGYLILWLSVESGQHKAFIKALNARIDAGRKAEATPSE